MNYLLDLIKILPLNLLLSFAAVIDIQKIVFCMFMQDTRQNEGERRF